MCRYWWRERREQPARWKKSIGIHLLGLSMCVLILTINLVEKFFLGGWVTLGDKSYEIAPFDCVYVSPGVAHQFRATGAEPLGFLCTVDRVRDRPEVIE